MKPKLKKLVDNIIKLRIILISLTILVVIGLAVLEVEYALNPPIDEDRLSEGQANQAAAEVRIDTSIIDKISERDNGTAPILPVGNPFEYRR